MQSHLDGGRTPASVTEGVGPADAHIDAGYIRENIGVLAAKVGDIRARMIAIEGLAERVADAAGVSYTDPEVHLGIEQLLTESGADDVASHAWTAESLGRELDGLERQLSAGREQLELLDAVLTRRTGTHESLPTFAPVEYPAVSSSYGWRRHPVTGRHALHEGLDFVAPRGAPIHAASGGIVTLARYVPGYGKMVEISHGNGVVTRYAHASSIAVKPGQLVSRGQQIARVGSTGRSTGNHLHFEVRVAGHPLDPSLFLEPWPQADSNEASTLAAAAASPADSVALALAPAIEEAASSGSQLR